MTTRPSHPDNPGRYEASPRILTRERCDCGQLAVTAITVTVLGAKQKMHLCADCLAKERAQVAMGYTQ